MKSALVKTDGSGSQPTRIIRYTVARACYNGSIELFGNFQTTLEAAEIGPYSRLWSSISASELIMFQSPDETHCLFNQNFGENLSLSLFNCKIW